MLAITLAPLKIGRCGRGRTCVYSLPKRDDNLFRYTPNSVNLLLALREDETTILTKGERLYCLAGKGGLEPPTGRLTVASSTN